MNSVASEIGFQFLPRHADVSLASEQNQIDMLSAELEAARAREAILLREKQDLAQRQVMLTEEFEHRLINGLQVIASLLSLQSRTASTEEAAAQLAIAAGRVAALARVHHRLHLLDHEERVQIEDYLRHLCEDLSSLLSHGQSGCAIVFEGANAEIPTALAIPLGFIVNELATNSAKHGNGSITVRFESTSPFSHSLTVLDDGPGLPAGFNPADSKGLGMKIIQALVTQIGGALHLAPGNDGSGSRILITFCSSSGEIAAN
jgi:two-component sensor histidine kinase